MNNRRLSILNALAAMLGVAGGAHSPLPPTTDGGLIRPGRHIGFALRQTKGAFGNSKGRPLTERCSRAFSRGVENAQRLADGWFKRQRDGGVKWRTVHKEWLTVPGGKRVLQRTVETRLAPDHPLFQRKTEVEPW